MHPPRGVRNVTLVEFKIPLFQANTSSDFRSAQKSCPSLVDEVPWSVYLAQSFVRLKQILKTFQKPGYSAANNLISLDIILEIEIKRADLNSDTARNPSQPSLFVQVYRQPVRIHFAISLHFKVFFGFLRHGRRDGGICLEVCRLMQTNQNFGLAAQMLS